MLPLLLSFAASCGAGLVDSPSETEGIYVEGSDTLTAAGPEGGPFNYGTVTYQVVNLRGSPVEWAITIDEPWLAVSVSSGMLDAFQSVAVAVSLTAGANQLPAGTHSSEIAFTNLTDGIGDSTHVAVINVTPIGSVAMNSATRTTGVAPLAVTFDAADAGSGVVQPPGNGVAHIDFSYSWDYGDPTSGTWQHNGKSKNASNCWIGAHVFEMPGTYRVTLKVEDDQGTVYDYHQDITVTDPQSVFAGRTYYVASNGSDSNPGTTSQPFASVSRGIAATFSSNGPSRLLFRRGDTFVTAESPHLGSYTGPFLIGAYGSGDRPVLTFTGQHGGFNASGSTDVRFVDLDMRASSTSLIVWARGIELGHEATVHNCRLDAFGYGLGLDNRRNVTVSASEILNNGEYGLYAHAATDSQGKCLALLGNRFDGAGQHLFRCFIGHSLIHSNRFQNSQVTAIKMCGRSPTTPARFNCVESNVIETETVWVMEIGPENQTSDQHVRDVMLAGNVFRNLGSNSQVVVNVFAQDITIRNNVFDVAGVRAIMINQRGIGPVPRGVLVEHNTAYRHSGSPLFFLGATTSDSTHVENNILFCRQGSASTPSGTVTLLANLTTDPQFEDPGAGDYRLRATSPAIDTGQGDRVRLDFGGDPRPVGAGCDVGAFERQ